MPLEERAKLDWRLESPPENVNDDEVLTEPFNAVENYFRQYLSDYLDSE
jgi:hypothetical protein